MQVILVSRDSHLSNTFFFTGYAENLQKLCKNEYEVSHKYDV